MTDPIAQGLGYAGGVMALIGGLYGASIGIGLAGSAGTAAMTEDPQQFKKILLLAALPMAQIFFGLVIMLNFIIYVNNHPEIDIMRGLALLSIGFMAGVAQAYSAKKLGDVCAAGIAELPRTKGKITLNTMILTVYAGLIGILALALSFMAISLIG